MIDGTYKIKVDVPFGRKEGTVLNICCWDDSLRSILAQYYTPYKDGEGEEGTIGSVQVHWIVKDPDDYQEDLDRRLLRNGRGTRRRATGARGGTGRKSQKTSPVQVFHYDDTPN